MGRVKACCPICGWKEIIAKDDLTTDKHNNILCPICDNGYVSIKEGSDV